VFALPEAGLPKFHAYVHPLHPVLVLVNDTVAPAQAVFGLNVKFALGVGNTVTVIWSDSPVQPPPLRSSVYVVVVLGLTTGLATSLAPLFQSYVTPGPAFTAEGFPPSVTDSP